MPTVTRLQLATPDPAAGIHIKNENQAVDLTAPAIQTRNTAFSTALSPVKQYWAEWCELKDIDPNKMGAQDDVHFKLAWDMFKVTLKA
jgi:hypothetical protein